MNFRSYIFISVLIAFLGIIGLRFGVNHPSQSQAPVLQHTMENHTNHNQ